MSLRVVPKGPTATSAAVETLTARLTVARRVRARDRR